MKKFCAALCLIPLLLTGCTTPGQEQPGSSQASQTTSSPPDTAPCQLTEKEQADLREYALSFADFFDTPFDSVQELDYQEIGLNTLFWIAADPNNAGFETDEHGYSYIPKLLLQDFVREHFGIEEYEYPVSNNPNSLPQYDKERDAYLFTPARDGPRAATAILKERQEGRTITYTIQLDYPHMETGELLKTVVMDYTFALTITAEGYTLCILSATEQ